MYIKTLGVVALTVAGLAACNQNRVQVSESGLRYQMHQQNEGARKPKVGEMVTVQLILKAKVNGKDSTLRDTHKEPTAPQFMLQVPTFKGSFEEGLAMMGKGDSATFFVKSDSLFTRAGQSAPPGFAKGGDIEFIVKLLNVQNEQEFQKAQIEFRDKQKAIDEKVITAYLAKNNMTGAQRTTNGVYYIIKQAGVGPTPKKGDEVQVHYTGKLLDGKVFDSSLNNPQGGGQPLKFQIGTGTIIPGWDESIILFPKGTKATILIPSSLAYGQQGGPPTIPPNAVLMFDVDVVGFGPAPKQAPMMPGAPGSVPGGAAPGGAGR
ncbi:FKBP-type peptidyl-prolyl cis-trans isomerase [Fibrella sp. HMF5335]|uniref:Peptidyl-prolyl cis-trans isomerase n=1 Tax=Fibrella rubiginis TaxID=2817060 RepID=A0A939GJR7_9BACT|nr:FKBP-type peptidyl-prolyl cis-trans isomerase [Fibrella rubiginis]MBO0939601.1 FKBP-type peptidyl-prolyl cis-trans isomerase [Fibrella rubiginis]